MADEEIQEQQPEPQEVIRDPEGLKRTLDKVRAEAKEKEKMISELKKQLVNLEGKLAGLSEDAIRAKQLESEAEALRSAIQERDAELNKYKGEIAKSRAVNIAISALKQKGATINHEAFITAVNKLPIDTSNIEEEALADAIATLASAFVVKQPSPPAPMTTAGAQDNGLQAVKSPLIGVLKDLKKI